MSHRVRAVQLPQRDGSTHLPCDVLAEVSNLELIGMDETWHRERAAIMRAMLEREIPREVWPQSLHWDWSRKILAEPQLSRAIYGIRAGERWLGAMLLRLDPRFDRARLEPHRGRPLVYVDYVESAPSNWPIPQLNQRSSVKRIGTTLVLAAMARSRNEEFEGRVGLHALPQSERFYEGMGFTSLGPDSTKQGLVYFEVSGAKAQEVLSQGGWT